MRSRLTHSEAVFSRVSFAGTFIVEKRNFSCLRPRANADTSISSTLSTMLRDELVRLFLYERLHGRGSRLWGRIYVYLSWAARTFWFPLKRMAILFLYITCQLRHCAVLIQREATCAIFTLFYHAPNWGVYCVICILKASRKTETTCTQELLATGQAWGRQGGVYHLQHCLQQPLERCSWSNLCFKLK